ncbi:MAG TPA: OmpA family protein [Methylophilaceae bacterium]|jgi:outer membrane protein OmpA-like peptidoglycan-associated protein
MTTSKSNTWRWVGVFILSVILLLLWLNGHGPSFAGSSTGCCGQLVQVVEVPTVPTAEPVPEVVLQMAPAQTAVPEVPPCSADMSVAVEFDSGSATVSAVGMQQLDLVAKCLSEKTEVVGFTDNSGSAELNQKLSEQRAQAVVDYMVSQNPSMADLLTATGHGADNPVADNATEEGRKKNRRIQFVKQ